MELGRMALYTPLLCVDVFFVFMCGVLFNTAVSGVSFKAVS